jgi:hypothetical protein
MCTLSQRVGGARVLASKYFALLTLCIISALYLCHPLCRACSVGRPPKNYG